MRLKRYIPQLLGALWLLGEMALFVARNRRFVAYEIKGITSD
jgi:hypothetical protein